MFVLAAKSQNICEMEGTQFPDPKYSRLTTSEKPPLTSENRENLATRLNCKTLQFDSACRLPTLSQTNHSAWLLIVSYAGKARATCSSQSIIGRFSDLIP
jgi:hypothetical protein